MQCTGTGSNHPLQPDNASASAPEQLDPLGLTSQEADRRQQAFGANTLSAPTSFPSRRALIKLWAPVPWMLEAAVILEIVLGKYVEAGIIVGLLLFNAALGFLQEGRAQATLAALNKRLALNASVKRDGVWKILPASELVGGDIVKLSLGAIVAAEARILAGSVLLDQSMLTGESVPVEAGWGFQAYSGALVRRGEAVAEVTAIGSGTKFGHTAELVRTAHVESSQQKAVLRVVRNLAIFNGGVIILLLAYAHVLKMSAAEIVPLLLTGVLASIPAALPATFTLAAAIGASALAKLGVLPTRLSAVDEAASVDVLCVDKTGTLTANQLTVTAVRGCSGYDESHVLGFAALASSVGGQDPVDAAIQAAAHKNAASDLPALFKFSPFDPANKMSEALTKDAQGKEIRMLKGVFSAIAALTEADPDAAASKQELESQGYRVLAVAIGPANTLKLAGLIALSDPPRADANSLIKELVTLGVRTVMVTGDAPATAATVARAVGLACKTDVFAAVLPQGKFDLVKQFQRSGHTVAMCGDGANDAAALRQAQMGIAVSTATDIAKSAAGIVLTKPGLDGIVQSIKEGRIAFQRIKAYAMNSIAKKTVNVLFLATGLVLTGHAILTPMLMVIIMLTGDFLAMSLSSDNVQPSPSPNAWRIGSLTLGGVLLGVFNLLFCAGLLAFGRFRLALDLDTLRMLAMIILVFTGEAVIYVVRTRGHCWTSRPGRWVIMATITDVVIISFLAMRGIGMTPLRLPLIAGVLGASIIFTLVLDTIKVPLFHHLKIS